MPRQQLVPLLVTAGAILAMAVLMGLADLRQGMIAGVLGLLLVGALALFSGPSAPSGGGDVDD